MSSFLINPYGTGGAPGGVTSGLALWLAAWKESFANNDPVATLTDWSGNGRHFTQSSASLKPLFKTGVLNSQPGIFFDGSDDFLECAAFMSGSAAEMFMVVKCFDTGSSNWGGYKLDGNTLATHLTFFGTLHSSFAGTNRINYIPSPSSILTAGFIHQPVVASGTLTLYENGNVNKVSGSQTVSWYSGATPRHLMGASSTNANGSGQSNYFKGHILEVLLYQGARTTAERNAILAALSSRYGISYTSF